MIGYYDYTVILTYFSLLSAVTGIVVSLGGGGHPYYGAFFLLFCGFCDAFDGTSASRSTLCPTWLPSVCCPPASGPR